MAFHYFTIGGGCPLPLFGLLKGRFGGGCELSMSHLGWREEWELLGAGNSGNRCLVPANQVFLAYYSLGVRLLGGPWVGCPPGFSAALVASDARDLKSESRML